MKGWALPEKAESVSPKSFTGWKLDICRAVRADWKVGPAPASLFAAIADHANSDTRRAWPAVSSLAIALRISDKTVRKYLKVLVDAKWIRIVGRSSRGTQIFEILDQRMNAVLDQLIADTDRQREREAIRQAKEACPSSNCPGRRVPTLSLRCPGTRVPSCPGTRVPPNTFREHLQRLAMKEKTVNTAGFQMGGKKHTNGIIRRSATIHAFPLVARRDHVRSVAERLCRKSVIASRVYRRQAETLVRNRLCALGIAPAVIELEVSKFFDAVMLEVDHLSRLGDGDWYRA